MKTKHCFRMGGWLGKSLTHIRRKCFAAFNSFNLTSILLLFFKFKLFVHPICRRRSKALLLHYAEYLLLNKRWVLFKCLNIFMWHMCFFNRSLFWESFLWVWVCLLYFWWSSDNSPIWNSILKSLLQIKARYGCFLKI